MEIRGMPILFIMYSNGSIFYSALDFETKIGCAEIKLSFATVLSTIQSAKPAELIIVISMLQMGPCEQHRIAFP